MYGAGCSVGRRGQGGVARVLATGCVGHMVRVLRCVGHMVRVLLQGA